jgi:hypothetical protein
MEGGGGILSYLKLLGIGDRMSNLLEQPKYAYFLVLGEI